jgi:hypothetical protein
MEVQFIYGAKSGAFPAAIMAQALIAGCTLRISHPFVKFEVAQWTDFLHIVWMAAAECSRDSRGQEIEKKLPITINYNGQAFYMKVWFDIANGGLRYASID